MRFLASLLVLAFASQANAGLLTSAFESRLESWLGQGDLDFTNVFTKAPASNSYAFHAAVDGIGPTITLMRISRVENNAKDRAVGQILGGYNPQSWNRSGNFNLTSSNADRTGFIFNLSTDTKFDQRLSATASDPNEQGRGRYQTYNRLNSGPSFGAGSDLFLDYSLSDGYMRQYSYGVAGPGAFSSGYAGKNLLGDSRYIVTRPGIQNGFTDFRVSDVEVYTFAPAVVSPPVASVPEPASVALFGLLSLGAIARRRR
ncbi:PEP_CTERM-anchored TLD domain-containing protein [Rhodopirellula sp. MGV]|uniref:PEP_CTERM-anchored TLD domain-containing protein n=1 Tax=Rhodopirellula sp. MGV TaxID=2023130 RepID=UPI000B971F1D|nr:PEP_CTERM-anchored TLD domain-containing protein [Rhodopirellula sp. MGV]OYP34122.1 hypothetical protein CGZ80_15795 [Rhodopirellula sp. MGV]PNY33559.1 PEP-CTERM sorting domain-containing protein [Rhodopirellula baltica]